MKKYILAAVCLCAAAVAFAATKQWTYFGDAGITQVVADGKGGCAFVRLDTNDIGTICWLDKNGTARYVKPVGTLGMYQGCIVSCSSKQLVYAWTSPTASNVFVVVNADGIETQISATNGLVNMSFLQPFQNICDDPKGFFAVLYYVSSSRQDLVRFSNK